MSNRTSGAKSGFGNLLDSIRYEHRTKLGQEQFNKNGLKIGLVLYTFRKGEKLPYLSDWAAGLATESPFGVICYVFGVSDTVPDFIEEDFAKSQRGELEPNVVMSSSLGRFPVFVARNMQLPEPVPGDLVLVSFLEHRGVSYGVYEDFFSKSYFGSEDGIPSDPSLGAGGGDSVSRVLQSSEVLKATAQGNGASGYFARFKLSYNRDVFRGNLAKVMNEVKIFPANERRSLALRIAAWDAVMGGDSHQIDKEDNSKRTGFDCIGQNAKTLSIAYYLYHGVPLKIPLEPKAKPGKELRTLQLVQDGKFVYSNFIHYLSFEGSNDLLYNTSTVPLSALPLASAGISKRFKMRDGYVGTFGHIYTLVDRIGDITIWCEGRTAKTTCLTVMGGDGTKNNIDLSLTDWAGIDEGGVKRNTNDYVKKFWGNGDGVPASYKPYAYLGTLKEPW